MPNSFRSPYRDMRIRPSFYLLILQEFPLACTLLHQDVSTVCPIRCTRGQEGLGARAVPAADSKGTSGIIDYETMILRPTLQSMTNASF